MRQKRAKVYRRLVKQYVLHFGFREPFQVLSTWPRGAKAYCAVDNTFAEALVRYKVEDPLRQLGNALQVKVKPMITQCCMVALYTAETSAKSAGGAEQARAAVALAKHWERRKCNHKEAIAPRECLASVIGAVPRESVTDHRSTKPAPLRACRRRRRRAPAAAEASAGAADSALLAECACP